MPNFCDRERIGLVLLVSQQEERDAEDLRGGEDGVEGFPALAEALVIDCIDDVDDCVAIIVVFRPDGPDPALASEVPELEYG